MLSPAQLICWWLQILIWVLDAQARRQVPDAKVLEPFVLLLLEGMLFTKYSALVTTICLARFFVIQAAVNSFIPPTPSSSSALLKFRKNRDADADPTLNLPQ
ncbi:hypothetical protein C8R42DRAFT_638662 [Lentinula raphanica]|nr:hypothetical protein C8R42DRAFT_638662 [Lentinula raphanica]